MNKALNIHGYKGSPDNSAFAELQGLGVDVISPTIEYDDNPPDTIMGQLNYIIADKTPDFIVGTSLGGFFAALLAVGNELPVFLINPCIMPFVYLPKLGFERVYDIPKYAAMFSRITELDKRLVSTIVGSCDEVIDTHDLTKSLLGNRRYTEVPEGKHSGSTLPLREFFEKNLEYYKWRNQYEY